MVPRPMNPKTTDLYRELSDQVSVSSITHWLKEMIAIPSENPMESDARPGHLRGEPNRKPTER